MTQASFKPLLDELELATTVVAVAVAVAVTGSLVAEDVEDFEDVEHLCKSCLTLSLSLSLSIGVLGAVLGAVLGVCVCGHCQLFVSFVVCVCVGIGVIFHSELVIGASANSSANSSASSSSSSSDPASFSCRA
jgi:hypothetical protein